MKKAFLLILVSMILLLAFTSCDAIKGIVGGDTPELPEEEVCEHVILIPKEGEIGLFYATNPLV